MSEERVGASRAAPASMDGLSAELAALRIERTPAREADPRPGSRRFGWRFAFELLGLAALAAAWLPRLSESEAPPRPVALASAVASSPPTPSAAAAPVRLVATGYVVPQRTSQVGSVVWARILRTMVREGDSVKAGDLLFELDLAEHRQALLAARARAVAAKARVALARAALAETDRLQKRQSRLVASGATSRAGMEDLDIQAQARAAAVDAAEAESAAALADASVLEAQMDEYRILAPFDAIVVSKPPSSGEMATPEKPLLELQDASSLLLEVDVPEARLGSIRLGEPCAVVFDAFADKRFRGTTVEFGPKLNRAKATGLVKVKLVEETPWLRPEMAARVDFLGTQTKEEQP